MPRGTFVVLEGIDGSGTTTQVGAVAQVLRTRGHRVVDTCEPSSGPMGRQARELLACEARSIDPAALALLFAADRMDHVATTIAPAIERGDTVLCDRYLMSSWAYQSKDCDRRWVHSINAQAPWPDLTFLLDVPVETALARIAQRQNKPRERFEMESFQRHVHGAYNAELAEAPAGVVRIDGTLSTALITHSLVDAIQRHTGPALDFF